MPQKTADFRDVGDVLLDTAVPLLSGIISRKKLEKALRSGPPQEGWSHRQVAVRQLPLEKLKFEMTRLALPVPGERLFTPTWRSGRLHAHLNGSLFLIHEDGVAPQDGLCATAKHLLHDVPPALKMLAKPPPPLVLPKKKVEHEKAASKEQKKALKKVDTFFGARDGDKKWGAFAEEVSRKSFLKALSTDPRADEKLRLHADRMNRLKTGKVIGKAQGSGNTYDIVKLRGGGLGCTCGDWRYKRSVAPKDELDCKHLKAFRTHAGDE
jgi:hypothetical protein